MKKSSKRKKGDERWQAARMEGVVRNKGIKSTCKPKAAKPKTKKKGKK